MPEQPPNTTKGDNAHRQRFTLPRIYTAGALGAVIIAAFVATTRYSSALPVVERLAIAGVGLTIAALLWAYAVLAFVGFINARAVAAAAADLDAFTKFIAGRAERGETTAPTGAPTGGSDRAEVVHS